MLKFFSGEILLHLSSGIYLIIPSSGNYREYVEAPLADTLIPNACYHFSMYVNLTNTCRFTTDAIGVYFSDSAISGITDFNPLPFTPQVSNVNGNIFDTVNWTEISGEYYALGNETHLIIGNFKTDDSTNFILVNSNAFFDFAYVLLDDVSLIPCKPNSNETFLSQEIKIYPNPVQDYVNIQTPNSEEEEFILFDLTSRILLQRKFNHHESIDVQSFPEGIYFYKIKN